ncbi:MAG: hypothetical protein IH586_08715, partial [Anaerolineaceae bacterium]|nr:hypothetical protein [Anaerolineaceae bacterium]
MKRNQIRNSMILFLAVLLLAACQLPQQSGSVNSAVQPTAAVLQPTITPLPRPTKTPRPAPTATLDPVVAQSALAEDSVKEYFAALEKQDFEKAADLLSTFSLTVFEITRGDAVSALSQQRADGAAWSGLEIVETKPFNQQTLLVHVKYTLAGKDPANKDAKTGASAETEESRDEVWVVRQEAGEWRCNWNNLIDYRTLDVDAQTLNGVTVKPVQANRFPDRIQLVMLVQNRNNEPVVFGQVNEILGTFYFGSQAIEAEKTQFVFNPLRTVPDFKLEVKGTFDTYPDSIEIRKWKTYNVKPW